MRQKHQAEVSREEIVFCPRINVSSSICVETFTEEMDEVIINTPAYGPLYQGCCKESHVSSGKPSDTGKRQL